MINYAAKLGPRAATASSAAAAPDGAGRPSRGHRLAAGREPAYMHSFGLTDRWFVLAEFPFVVNPLALALSGRPYIENYRWKPERGTRFTLVDRRPARLHGGFETDACFAFHHVNAYDEGERVVVDVCTVPDAGIVEDLYLERLRGGCRSRSRAHPLSPRARRPLGHPRAHRRGGHRAATDQLRALQRAHVSYVWGDDLGPSGWFERDRQDRRPRRHRAQLLRARLLPRRARVRGAPRTPSDEDDGVLLSVVLDADAGDLVPARARRRRPQRAGPRRGAAPHPVRLPRPVRRA